MVASALASAKATGITDTAQLADIEKLAYPHFLHVMAILFLMNVLIMLAIGKLKPRTEPYIQAYTKQVDITPWKLVNQVGIIITLLVIAIYIFFAS